MLSLETVTSAPSPGPTDLYFAPPLGFLVFEGHFLADCRV
jgi:hypothetical protein